VPPAAPFVGSWWATPPRALDEQAQACVAVRSRSVENARLFSLWSGRRVPKPARIKAADHAHLP
jgi:hypothetical protein